MADYREISQAYAQGGIKAAILANGGGAVALLSQFVSLATIMPPKTIAAAMLVYVIGTALGLLAWLMAFMSTRHVDRAERGQDVDYSKADCFMQIGFLFVVLSILAFVIPALVLVAAV